MRVYWEEVFLINLVMDAVILAWTGRLWARRLRIPRALASAALGALWAVLGLVWPWLSGLGGQLLLPCLMVRAAWPWRGTKGYLGMLAAFWGLTWVGGGAVMAYGCARETLAGTNLWLLNAGAVLAVLALGGWALVPRRKRVLADCRRRLTWQGIPLIGLVDTGNMAVEPCSGLPVLVLSAAWAKGNPGLLAGKTGEMRWIPMATVGGEGLLPGYPARGWRWEDGTPLEDAYVAVGPEALAGGVDVLIPGMLERSGEDGSGLVCAVGEAGGAAVGPVRRCRDLLHRRQRRAAGSLGAPGGTGGAGGIGAGGYGPAGPADRAQPASGGVYRTQVRQYRRGPGGSHFHRGHRADQGREYLRPVQKD